VKKQGKREVRPEGNTEVEQLEPEKQVQFKKTRDIMHVLIDDIYGQIADSRVGWGDDHYYELAEKWSQMFDPVSYFLRRLNQIYHQTFFNERY
jgi:hypothetical protein